MILRASMRREGRQHVGGPSGRPWRGAGERRSPERGRRLMALFLDRHERAVLEDLAREAVGVGINAAAASARELLKAPEPETAVRLLKGQTPDPIPNSAVKTLSADGTAS